MDELVSTFSKNKFEEVRIQIKEYKGYDLIDFRIWTDVKGSTEKVPTTKGLALNVEHFPKLKEAMVTLEKILSDNKMLPK